MPLGSLGPSSTPPAGHPCSPAGARRPAHSSAALFFVFFTAIFLIYSINLVVLSFIVVGFELYVVVYQLNEGVYQLNEGGDQ